jgi:hypothetical protein
MRFLHVYDMTKLTMNGNRVNMLRIRLILYLCGPNGRSVFGFQWRFHLIPLCFITQYRMDFTVYTLNVKTYC